jgi:DNA-binding response OmpR family regulator
MRELDRSKFRILIVEDEFVLGAMLDMVGREAGYQIAGIAPTLREGVALAMSERLDAALLDINLPSDTEVFAVADVLDERGIPFAFVTGDRDRDVELLYRDRPLLFKPIVPEKIVDTLDALVSARYRSQASDRVAR